MKIAMIPYTGKRLAAEYACRIIERLDEFDCTYTVPENFRSLIKSGRAEYFTTEFETVKNADMAIAIGGDGTIIHTAKDAAVLGKPVLGVNCGRVGFVAGLEPSELDLLPKLFDGTYTVDERMILEISVVSGERTHKAYALNDVTVTYGSVSRMIDLDVHLNGEFITEYRADGVILSTPTGSTAYSLSAGGPVIEPHMKCILLTPICPHSLFSRSVLFSDDSEVTIYRGRDSRENPFVTVDGRRSETIGENDCVSVRKADISARFIKLNNKNFYRILDDKLNERMR